MLPGCLKYTKDMPARSRFYAQCKTLGPVCTRRKIMTKSLIYSKQNFGALGLQSQQRTSRQLVVINMEYDRTLTILRLLYTGTASDSLTPLPEKGSFISTAKMVT